MSLKKKYFGTDGIRGRYGIDPISDDFMANIATAISQVIPDVKQKPVVIGTDTRESAEALEAGLQKGLAAYGIEVYLLGVLPTPTIAFAARHYNAALGIVISASHNPYQDNGIKFFDGKGFKLSSQQESAIEEKLFDVCRESVATQPQAKMYDICDDYAQYCFSQLSQTLSLSSMKVIIDCANGAGSSVAERVFSPLGSEISLIHHQPNGKNINQHCGSTNPEQLQCEVRKKKADIGIAFDGDADRVILVNAAGEIVDGDQILYILASFLHQKNQLEGGVVGTQMSNLGLEVALKNLSIPFSRSQVGDRYVMEQLQQQGWFLGGEGSGHVLNLSLSTTGDGILIALQVLSIMQETGKSLAELSSGMDKYPQILINVPVSNKNALLDHPKVKKALCQEQQQLAKTGRILLRPSGTESLVRVMVEGEAMEAIEPVAQRLVSVIEQFS